MARKLMTKRPQDRLQCEVQAERHLSFRITQRQVSLALVGLALVYAFLSGFHTLFDLDMGWHLATGRYIVQHHAVPSTDVLSYTSPGAEWIYPPFAGVLFYAIYNALGYSGLTWFCALSLTALVACLVQGSFSQSERMAAAALAIFAVPSLAVRMVPRPDLFTQLFFAIFLIQLWSFHRSSASVSDDPKHDGSTAALPRTRQRLWILPLVMLLWVNLHPGFLAGLGVLIAYLLVEGLELVFPLRRKPALLRLWQAWPALATTLAVTLLNPFGYKIFKASLILAGVQPGGQAGNGPDIWELQAMPISLPSLAQALDWRSLGSSYWWLAAIALVVVALALCRRQLGAALVMAVALFGSIQHLRYQGMFAITAIVVGGAILPDAFPKNRQASAKISVERASPLRWLAVIIACALCLLLTCVRIADLISSRAYIVANSATLFGTGESWWFPERAAAFIHREDLPGNIFQDYNLGGFTAWRLGPAYRDFIDGRNVSPAVWTEKQEFISAPPDSPLWEKESDRQGINLLFFPLGRFSGGGTPDLMSLCQSHLWRPVYLDEVSIVLLRNRPENRPWVDRFEVNCSSHQFLPPTQVSRRELSNFYANLGSVLLSLNRNDEAMDALVRGEGISPDDPVIHRTLAILYGARQQSGDAEQEYKTALSLRKDLAVSWFDLGEFYFFHRRFADARPLVLTAAQLTLSPVREYLLLGYIDLALHQSEPALLDFSKAEKAIVGHWQGRQNVDPDFYAEIAEGRAQAYLASGEQQRAIESQLEAIRRTPEVVSRWQALASIYDAAGRPDLAEQARQKAQALHR
jgi:tetratricopeptide (TPR) repeat protein